MCHCADRCAHWAITVYHLRVREMRGITVHPIRPLAARADRIRKSRSRCTLRTGAHSTESQSQTSIVDCVVVGCHWVTPSGHPETRVSVCGISSLLWDPACIRPTKSLRSRAHASPDRGPGLAVARTIVRSLDTIVYTRQSEVYSSHNGSTGLPPGTAGEPNQHAATQKKCKVNS